MNSVKQRYGPQYKLDYTYLILHPGLWNALGVAVEGDAVRSGGLAGDGDGTGPDDVVVGLWLSQELGVNTVGLGTSLGLPLSLGVPLSLGLSLSLIHI